MQDNKLVYSYAFTTRKFPSTSHAARIKSMDRSEEDAGGMDVLLTFPAITKHHFCPPFEAVWYRDISRWTSPHYACLHLYIVYGVYVMNKEKYLEQRRLDSVGKRERGHCTHRKEV